MFNPVIVDVAIEQLKSGPGLGKPARILVCKAPLGVGVEWPGSIRNAVAFHGKDAADNCAEVRLRVEEWIAH